MFLLDVNNTLLDNDQVIADLRGHLEQEVSATSAGRYWAMFERLRGEFGYADYLGALQRYRLDAELGQGGDSRLLQMSTDLIDYPFADRLYPHAFAVIEHLNAFGRTVILSDGDAVFQPRKIQRSGLWDAVSGRVLIYIHKEQMLESVQRQYPALHYAMVDDKLRILAAMRSLLPTRPQISLSNALVICLLSTYPGCAARPSSCVRLHCLRRPSSQRHDDPNRPSCRQVGTALFAH